MIPATVAIELAARSRVVIQKDLELIQRWLIARGLPFDVRRGLQQRERQLLQFLDETADVFPPECDAGGARARGSMPSTMAPTAPPSRFHARTGVEL